MSDLAGKLKVELGGGMRPRGDGWINVDLLSVPGVEWAVDFERLGVNGAKLPFDDDSVGDLYSSHCLEHVRNTFGVMREISRICCEGAHVEIRVPHWLSQHVACPGHVHALSEHVVEDVCVHFIDEWWHGCRKRLRLEKDRTERIRWAERYDRAAKLFFRLSERDIIDFIPGTCHEVRFHFTVVPNG